MEQLAWTLTALLAASTFGNMYYLGSKLDNLSSRLDWVVGQVGELRAELGEVRGEMAMLRASFESHRHDPHAH